ncbi:MAG: S41 family peptidase [Candidatus Moranbacteria bacterium]|nr:S41 family peptidase [Candidatus Moranbacteria bacterium]
MNNTNLTEQNNKQIFYTTVVFTALFFSLIFLLVGFFLGKELTGEKISTIPFNNSSTVENAISKNEEIDFTLFWEVWDLLEKKYVDHDQLDSQEMMYGAINGMLMSTGDPHTIFLDAEQKKALEEELSGDFEGIGAEIGIKDNILTVVSPLDDSPAMRSGLMAGDKIVKINGEETSGLNIYEAVSKIKGKKGTEVVLNIYRSGEDDVRDVSVIRDAINVKSVKVEFVGDVAHIKLMQFGLHTKNELEKVIGEIQDTKNIKGVVLDVRNNSGGYMGTAIEVASKFLKNDLLVVSQLEVDDKEEKHYSYGYAPFVNIPVVVLINEGSASASEIVAGALRDNRDDIVLVGKKSYGKGSVQELIPNKATKKKTAAKITIAKWFTPNGDQINEKGIEPDVEVEFSIEDYENDRDPQLDKAIEVLKERVLSVK